MMKKLVILSVLFSIFLVACSESNITQNQQIDTIDIVETFDMIDTLYNYYTFEEALLEHATNIVIAQYVGSRSFGDTHTEFEFIVSESLLGEVTERIFVFAEHGINAHVHTHNQHVHYVPGDLEFVLGVYYLLPLIIINSPYSGNPRDEDEFVFILQIVIDLDEPSNSTMYSEYLDAHVQGMNFNEEATTEEILSFVEDLAEQIKEENSWEFIFIRSENLKDIIEGSPYVLVIEVTEPLRLSHEQSVTIWGLNDIYYATVIQALKGDLQVGDEIVVTFFADTVFPGERHIVAVVPLREGSTWYDFTSRNSLFSLEQLDEIMSILGY